MIRQEICEALYALPNGVVQPRRRPITRPVITAIVGIALLIAALLMPSTKEGTLEMALIVGGGVLMLYGLCVVMIRYINHDTVPYHTPSKSYMSYRERYYTLDKAAELKAAIADKDYNRLEAIETSNISALIVAECRTKDGSIVALALYEYAIFEHLMVGKVAITQS